MAKNSEILNGGSVCGASSKERRKCPIDTPSYGNCVNCPFIDVEVNLGKPGLRGGIETSRDSTQWRHIKKVFGIAHGDD